MLHFTSILDVLVSKMDFFAVLNLLQIEHLRSEAMHKTIPDTSKAKRTRTVNMVAPPISNGVVQ
ncbi:hypothetical protein OAN307_c40910 [Octadecabacter antarcticus 307]|uniref:Uncharacterized protein n=1 Tax=Octadecabacter antarcticus 307 TaxID=391626 RepID=M9RGI7_9RHOB|nr:hypothetical protein OAN307_c40910 [Octadecabacter antarcticus 307]